MLLILTLISSGKQVIGLSHAPTRKGIRLVNKCYQHTAAQSFEPQLKSGQQQQKFNKPVFNYANLYKDKIAVRDKYGEYTYSGLLSSSEKFAKKISESLQFKTGERVVFLCPNDATYIVTQWACWISGQIGNVFYTDIIYVYLYFYFFNLTLQLYIIS